MSTASYTREAEWDRITADSAGEQVNWYRLVSESTAETVIVTKDGYIQRVDELARALVAAAVEYASVIEICDDPPREIVLDYLEDMEHAYRRTVSEVCRLPEESLRPLVEALVDVASGLGAEWVTRRVGDWTRLVTAWHLGNADDTPAGRAANQLVPAIVSRWTSGGQPSPLQEATVDTKTVVGRAVVGFTRDDLLELARRLENAAVGIGAAAAQTDVRPSLPVWGLRLPYGNLPSKDEAPPF